MVGYTHEDIDQLFSCISIKASGKDQRVDPPGADQSRLAKVTPHP